MKGCICQERVYLPLYQVAVTLFHIQGDVMLVIGYDVVILCITQLNIIRHHAKYILFTEPEINYAVDRQ